MTPAWEFRIEGIGIWCPELVNWPAACAAFAEAVGPATHSASRPAPGLLPPAERRRAPETVLVALEAAQQACSMAGRAPRDLAHVFASAYGDLAINDYLCEVLARAPLEVSPTRFHNSVHNAAAGYWTIATGCRRSSSAISAGPYSFGAGLLEAASLAQNESEPALLVAYDSAASGPLRDVIACRSSLGVALVLAPASGRDDNVLVRMRVLPQPAQLAPEPALLQANHQDNPAARGLALLAAISRREPAALQISAGPQVRLDLEIVFCRS
jgi:hypothetical protein